VALAGEDLIFRSIKAVDYEEVFRILHHDQKRLETRNADAAAPIHVAFLFLHHDLGQAMIEAYPWCALFEYGPGPYEGENCLHIVISQRKYGPFEWLLTHHPELLNAETIGEFFAPTGIAYFGGYPLLFAVSTNQTAMVQCIAQLNAGNTSVMNRIHVADRFGNNALHMAVIHDLPEMAQFIWELDKADPMQPPLAERANDEGLTPLALAAAMGRVAMFRLLLTCGIREAWVYGPMKGNMVPLRGLDQPYLLGRDRLSHCRLAMACFCAPGEDRVTRCLPSEVPDNVRKGRLELALLPEIRAILDKKWKHFGRRLFLRRFIPILIVMAKHPR
jgi:transient receptor potential cation channel subfamily V protein 6